MKIILHSLAFLAISTAVLPLFAVAQEPFDLLIKNGRIVDGTGTPWYEADVGIVGDRITRVGNLSGATAHHVIDAPGLIVAPGFIDPHTHALRGIFDVPNAESALLQGVTTLTEGNDGSSPYPIDKHYADIQDLRISPNWAVRDAMEQGALGISTGLFYVPGSFTSTEEVIELSKVAAEYNGIYISHIREEAAQLIDSVQETIRIGEEAGIPVQITHHKVIGVENWGASIESLQLVD